MKFIFFIYLLSSYLTHPAPSAHEPEELSLFSIKTEGILVSVPKVHRWRYYPGTQNRGKIFSLRSRNGSLSIFLYKLQNRDSLEQIFTDMGWEEDLDIKPGLDYQLLVDESSRYREFSRKNSKIRGIEFIHNNGKFFYFVKQSGTEEEGFAKRVLNGVERFPPILPLDKNRSSHIFSKGHD